MTRLYEFPEMYRLWMDKVEANEGELSPELVNELEKISASLETKVDSYAGMIRQFKYEEEMFREEAKRMARKSCVAAAKVEGLKRLLLQTMRAMQASKLKGREFHALLRRSSVPKITWESNDDIPEPYRRVEVSLDYKEAWKFYRDTGALPEGFKVVYSEFVQIY